VKTTNATSENELKWDASRRSRLDSEIPAPDQPIAYAQATKPAPCRMANQERRALSIGEAARTCGLSRSTLYRLLKSGKLTTVKVGARRLVPVHAIDALLNPAAP
jgi:excisionase family DNA binding protein